MTRINDVRVITPCCGAMINGVIGGMVMCGEDRAIDIEREIIRLVYLRRESCKYAPDSILPAHVSRYDRYTKNTQSSPFIQSGVGMVKYHLAQRELRVLGCCFLACSFLLLLLTVNY